MSDFTTYPNPMYGRGVPAGTTGTVEIAGRRIAAVLQGWHLNRVWVQRGTDPREWFVPSRATAETFSR